jgi:hypothetical protein
MSATWSLFPDLDTQHGSPAVPPRHLTPNSVVPGSLPPRAPVAGATPGLVPADLGLEAATIQLGTMRMLEDHGLLHRTW